MDRLPIDTERLLQTQGWVRYYTCMCGGTPKWHYSNPRYPGAEIRIRPRRQTFALWKKNNQVYGPGYLYNLPAKLKEYELYEETAA